MRKQLIALTLTALLPIGISQALENTEQAEAKPQQQSLQAQRTKQRLSPEQQQSMRELHQNHRQAQQVLYQQTWKKLAQSDRDAYEAQRKQLREQNRTQMRALLTPGQQKRITPSRVESKQNKQNKSRRGMHRHSMTTVPSQRHGHSAKQRACS